MYVFLPAPVLFMGCVWVRCVKVYYVFEELFQKWRKRNEQTEPNVNERMNEL